MLAAPMCLTLGGDYIKYSENFKIASEMIKNVICKQTLKSMFTAWSKHSFGIYSSGLHNPLNFDSNHSFELPIS